MGKGSGGTRVKVPKNNNEILGYIRAFTSKGGADYSKFSKYDTVSNENKFNEWLQKQPKENSTVYRGGYMLSGDIVENIVYGGWEGKTLSMSDIVQTKATRATSFSKDGDRVFSYTEGYVSPKSKYDKFENENIRVKYIVKTNNKKFVDISNLSHYKEEKEVVGMKDAKFKFVSADYKQSWSEIHLTEV